MPLLSRGVLKRLIAYPGLLLLPLAALWVVSIRMPGRSFEGELPPLSAPQRESADRLKAHVEMLAARIGERNASRMPALARARSAREHGSTLLHYVSANGAENFRQKTLTNICCERSRVSRGAPPG